LTVSSIDAFNPILNNAIAFMDNMADLERFIRLSHSADPDCVNQRDSVGLTPLDVAVTRSNPTATRVLLELGVNLAPLRSRNNGDRLAPLASLQGAIRRERRKPPIAYLSELYNDPLPAMEQVEKLVKEVIGDYPMPSCSCGSCDDGWLSAKMRARLQGLFTRS
jgi:ankyrin repeat protein